MGPLKHLHHLAFEVRWKTKMERNLPCINTRFYKSWQKITPLTLRLALISPVWSRIKKLKIKKKKHERRSFPRGNSKNQTTVFLKEMEKQTNKKITSK